MYHVRKSSQQREYKGHFLLDSWQGDATVRAANYLCSGRSRNGGPVSDRGKNLSLLQSAQTNSGAHPTSFREGTEQSVGVWGSVVVKALRY